MAGDWIKMRTNLDTDPAVVRIASGQKLDRYAVVGRLHRIWSWANEHLTDGQDVPVDAAFLDSLVDTPGFAASMRDVGWLSGRDGCLCFPGFERHNGSTAKARALDAARKKSVRIVSEKCPDQNRTKTGPEKSREEKSIRKKSKPKESREARPASIDAVRAYCELRRKEGNPPIDPQAWWDYYESNGWRVGKNPMKDWQAAVRTWERNGVTQGVTGKQQLGGKITNSAEVESERRRRAMVQRLTDQGWSKMAAIEEADRVITAQGT